MPTNESKVHVIIARDRFVVPLKNGGRAFVKVDHTDAPEQKERFRKVLMRERTCLEVLDGLAVPKLVAVSPKAISGVIKIPAGAYLACSYEGAEQVDHADLSPIELLGSWLFLTEQFAAFRRHQIVYQDIKCSNVMVRTRRPLKVIVVDFGCATVIGRGGRIKREGHSASFAAPEAVDGHPLTESSPVYELGMLLAHVVAGVDNGTLKRGGMQKATRMVTKLGGRGVSKIMTDCLAGDPKKRPKNFEELFDRVREVDVPEDARRVWNDLRAPYADLLEEVGLSP